MVVQGIDKVCSGFLPPADAAGGGVGDAAGALNSVSPLSLLISRHIFQDGEIIELSIRASPWWIIFSSMRTLLFAAVIVLASVTLKERLSGNAELYLEAGVIIGLARLMWATVKWMSRLYVLTNLRVMTISGVFNVTIVECPLRRVGVVRLIPSLRERLAFPGTVEIIPMEEEFTLQRWQTLRRPTEVYRKLRAAVARARQHGA